MKIQKLSPILVAGLLITIGLFAYSPRELTQQPIKYPPSELPPQSARKDKDDHVKNQATNTQNAPDTKAVDPQKHPSKIIAKSPSAPDIPYFLLGSVSDPYYSSSWSLATTQANRAWDLTTGSASVSVAVIDTGFALSHEELTGKWALNSGEQGTTSSGDACWTGAPASKQSNNCDDDSNGYTDDWRGYDFAYNDNNVAAGQVNPNGEGTQHASLVSGVIAATANNGKGSAGIDQNVRIMPLQVFDDDSNAYTTDLVAAIEYAVDNGANIINLSLGTNAYDAPLLSAINYARSNNVLVIAASGNCALNDDVFCNSLAAPGRMTYPALYDQALAVGSTASDDARSNFSSYGPKLDLVAPGSSIQPLPLFTAANQTSAYASASGTSFSAPLVAGVASLLLAQNPSATPSELEYILTESADKISGMAGSAFSNEYGYGRLNAHKATLLGLAKTQDSLLGDAEIGARQASVGAIWRASTGAIQDDESILIGCRVFVTDSCSVSVQNTATYRFLQGRDNKGNPLQYIFIRGGQVPSGTWQIAVHNRHYATQLASLTK